MKSIEYRITYTEGGEEIVRVYARSINSGFPKALKHGREKLANGVEREIARVEFWQVTS